MASKQLAGVWVGLLRCRCRATRDPIDQCLPACCYCAAAAADTSICDRSIDLPSGPAPALDRSATVSSCGNRGRWMSQPFGADDGGHVRRHECALVLCSGNVINQMGNSAHPCLIHTPFFQNEKQAPSSPMEYCDHYQNANSDLKKNRDKNLTVFARLFLTQIIHACTLLVRGLR